MSSDKFNLNYKHNADMKAVPDDRNSMQAYVDFLLERVTKVKLDSENLRAMVKIYGEIGTYANILGNYDLAEQYLKKALTLIDEKKLGILSWATNTIRYGDTLRFKKDLLGAETAYRSVLEMAGRFPELKDLEDFAWQHLGKLKITEGDLKIAQDYLSKARALREKKGIKELIDSTDIALKIIQSKLSIKKKY
jgi:tetratricopeptide (TPR) repeat protein